MSYLGYSGYYNKVSTPLHMAIKNGDAIIDDDILKNNINIKDGDGRLPIHVACMVGSPVAVEKLLNHGASINSLTNSKFQPLHLAVEKGHEEVIELLLRQGADINAADNDMKDTPLHLAVKEGLLKTVEQLLSRGASVNVTNSCDQTVLHIAVEKEFVEIVETLLNHNSSFHGKDLNGSTPLHISVNDKISKMLLDKGADVNAKNFTEETALYGGKSVEVAKVLLEYGLDVNSVNIHGETVLFGCTNETIVRMLLEKGANINAKTSDGSTALHNAVWKGYVDIVELLLEYKADVTVEDNDGMTPLCFSSDEIISRMLISKSANVNAKSHNGLSPIHCAVQSGCEENVEVLLECGVDVNCLDTGGATPLYYAACAGNCNLTEILLNNGANVNNKTKDGNSPLSGAIQGGYFDVTCVLLQYGANFDEEVVTETTVVRENFAFFPDYLPTINELIEIVENHFITLKALEPDKKIPNLPWMDFNAEENRRLYDSYKNQADLMTHEKIGNTHVSFRDILTKSIHQVAAYASNKSIVEAIEFGEYKWKFPAYSDLIEIKFKMAQKREFLLKASARSLRSLISDDLPDVVIEGILSYLSYHHLRMLIQASPDITNEQC